MKNINPSDAKTKYRWLCRLIFPFILLGFSSFLFLVILFSESDKVGQMVWENLLSSFWGIIGLILMIPFIFLFIFLPFLIYFKLKLFSIKFNVDAILIRQGIFSKKNIKISYDKIQDVIIERDLWDRILKTSRLVFFINNLNTQKQQTIFNQFLSSEIYHGDKGYGNLPPGINGERLFLPGLSIRNAEKLRNLFLLKI